MTVNDLRDTRQAVVYKAKHKLYGIKYSKYDLK